MREATGDMRDGGTDADTARSLRSTSTPGQVLVVASLGAVLSFVDATIVNVAFPDIVRDFDGADLADVSWVLNAYNIVFAALLVAAGRFADLLGRKRLFETGIVVFTVASVLCALAPTLELLVATRILQAIGAAIVVPSSLALVIHAFPGERRGHGVALWSAIAALAAGLGPALGGVLVEIDGWRLAFLVNLPIGLVALHLARTVLVENRAPGRRTLPDLLGALQLGASIALATLALVKGGDWGWADPRVLGSLVASAVLAVAVARRCTWHPSPMIDLGLLRIRSVAAANALTVVGAAGYYGYVLCNVLFLTTVWGYSVLDAGLAMTPGPFVAAAVARPASRLAERIGPMPVLAAGAAIWAFGVALLVTVVGPSPAFLTQWLPVACVLAVGAGVTFPVVGATAVAEVPGGRFGTATGLNAVARQLGAVLGVALLVAIVGHPAPGYDLAAAFDRGWTFAGICFAACAVGAIGVGRTGSEPSAARPVAVTPSGAGVPSPAAPVEPPRIARRWEDDPESAAGAPVASTTGDRPSLLRDVPIFSALSPAALAALARQTTARRLEAGSWLLRAGDAGDALYVVTSGRLEVVKDDEVVEVLGRGRVLGELALLTSRTRSASVRVRRDAEVLVLSRPAFDALLQAEPTVARALLATLGEHLQRTRIAVPPRRGRAATIAVVQLIRDACPALADELCAALAARGSVGRIDGSCPDPDDDGGLLERLERENDRVVMTCRATDGEAWRRFALRHADRVVVAASAARRPPASVEPGLRGADLVLVDAVGGVTTDAWLDVLQPRAHHHVSGAGAGIDVARAARRVAGTAVGVVLSGGGARALAHIGVLEVLVDAGITVDRVGGCSFGAFTAALLARGHTPREIDAICFDEWVRRRPVGDYTVPRVAITRGARLRALGERILPGRIEDLPLDFFCNSADLETGEMCVHRRGAVAPAVLASAAVPGLIPPVRLGRRVLVDGGVLNNLPVEEMLERDEGPVIGVDVSSRLDPRADGGLPGIAETLTSGLLLGSVPVLESNRRRADLLVEPDPDGVGRLEFHQLDRAVEAGRAAASAALADAPDWFGAALARHA